MYVYDTYIGLPLLLCFCWETPKLLIINYIVKTPVNPSRKLNARSGNFLSHEHMCIYMYSSTPYEAYSLVYR